MKWKNLFIMLPLLAGLCVQAQTAKERARAKQLFGGEWYNKKDDTHIRMFFNEEYDVLINEWKGEFGKHNESIDAFKAQIKGDKLIMPKETGDHNAPYCEMLIVNKKLLFRCKGFLDRQNEFLDNTYFVKIGK